MSDTTTDAVEQGTATEVETDASSGAAEASFSERYSEILAKVNGTLDQVDWSQMVVGQWSWHNLTTSEKRGAVVAKVQNLRKEYLG